MSALDNRFDETGVGTFYAGEVIALELQLVDEDGASDVLSGRSFSMTIYDQGREPITKLLGRIVEDRRRSFIQWIFPGTVSEQLYGQTSIGYQVAEELSDGINVIIDSKIKIKKGPVFTPATATSLPIASTVTRFVITDVDDARPTMIISQHGGRGDPGEAADIIDDANVDPTLSWSSEKINTLISTLMNRIAVLEAGGGGTGPVDPDPDPDPNPQPTTMSLDFSDPNNSGYLAMLGVQVVVPVDPNNVMSMDFSNPNNSQYIPLIS